MVRPLIKYVSLSATIVVGLYACLLGLLTTSAFQANVVYLHRISMTWGKDLNVPEIFGFLRNQVSPFSLTSSDGETLYAWHILPLELYRQYEAELIEEPVGFVSDMKERLAFRLLRDDPEARLVLHFHGAAGTVGSGYRVPNYRALSAGHPGKIHVLTFDYRGFGHSTGTPSEQGLILDAQAVAHWVMDVAGLPPSRILIFGQSMGTAVSLALAEYFALQEPPAAFAGILLVAPFVDVPRLVVTYRVAGVIPILSPLARFPFLFGYLQRYIRDSWSSMDRVARFVGTSEEEALRYRLTFIHAGNDYDVPWHHTPTLFWHAVNATSPSGLDKKEFEERKLERRKDLGAAGTVVEWETGNGVIREEILKTGLHDVIMGYPVISMAVMRALFGMELGT